MRHRKTGVKLGRTSSHRDAMFRNMVTSLFKHDRIRTTDIKAKELRRWADHMITLAKSGDLHSRRMAMAIVREKDVVHKLFETAGERFGAISGGYTRLVKIGRRAGDAAPMTIIELVGPESAPKKKKKKAKVTKESAPAAVLAAPQTDPTADVAAAEAAPSEAASEAAAETKAEETVDAQATEATAEAAAEAPEDVAQEAASEPEGKKEKE